MACFTKKRQRQTKTRNFRCAHTHDPMATTRIVMRKRRDVPAGFKPPPPVTKAPAAGTTSAAGANPPSAGTKVAATNAPGKDAPVVGTDVTSLEKKELPVVGPIRESETLEEKEAAKRPHQLSGTPVLPPLIERVVEDVETPSPEVRHLYAQFEQFARTTQHKGEELVTLMANFIRNNKHFAKPKRTSKMEAINALHMERVCHNWVSARENHNPTRVVTWCVLTSNDPDTCGPTVCFDVDEVQDWIKAKTQFNSQGQTTDAKGTVIACDPLPCQCAMFMRAELQAKINELSHSKDEYIVPEYMTSEFREAFEDFDMWRQLDITKITRDRTLDAIRKQMEKWISAGAQSSDEALTKRLGTFWFYTKRALAPVKWAVQGAWSATWFLLKNPFLLLAMVTIAKIVRMSICLFSSYETMGRELTLLLVDQLLTDMTRTSRLIKAVLVGMVTCFSKGIYAWFSPSCWGATFDAFGALGQAVVLFFSSQGKSLFESLGFPGVASWVYSLSNSADGLLSRIFFGDQSFFGNALTNIQNMYDIMRKYPLQDWDLLAVLAFLSACPLDFLATWIIPTMLRTLPVILSAGLDVAAYFIPGAGAVAPLAKAGVQTGGVVLFETYNYLLKKYGTKPMLWLKFLAQSQSTSMAFVQLLTEVKDWIVEILPCMWDYFKNMLQYYFGFITGTSDPQSATTCCMTQMVRDLQALNFTKQDEADMRAQLATREDETKKQVYKYLDSPTPANKEVAQIAVDSFAADIADEALRAQVSVDTNGVINLSNATPFVRGREMPLRQVAEDGQPLVLPREMAIDLVPLSKQNTSSFAQIIGRGTSHIGSWFSGIWATPSDMRLKNLVFDEPVFEIKTKDGNVIPFYVFVWKPEAGFADNYRMHISVMAQQIEKLYPNAVFVYHGVKLVLLKRLPPEVAKHILMSNNVLVDLRKLA